MADHNGFAEWGGYMGAKITKLEEQLQAASDPFRKSNLFAGISIFVNGRTNPTADELKRIMMTYGGTYHIYQRPYTSYVIASNLPDVKVRNMNTSKIISPQWVVDCVRDGRILDYTRYLLYTQQRKTQPRIQFVRDVKGEQAATADPPAEVQDILQGLEQLKAQMRQSSDGSAQPAATKTEAPQQPTSIARTANDPKFLAEFYNNSRLHHIATLGAGFKQYVSELRERHALSGQRGFTARRVLAQRLGVSGVAPLEQGTKRRRDNSTSCIMHIDMDCFFVSVGLRSHPHLRGQPVAVTHSKGGAAASAVPVHADSNRQLERQLYAQRFGDSNNVDKADKVRQGFEAQMSLSEISSCSYEARARGLHNGMFVGQALQLCPELQTIPYDFEGYKEVAYTLYDTVADYTLSIEAVSCDEMFVDLGDVLDELQLPAMEFVRALRAEVRTKTGCPCSAGVGANKLQARLATKRAKPDGQYCLPADDVLAYMADMAIRELPGVGSSTAHTLNEAQLSSCGDLQRVTLARLQMLVGKKLGETLHQFARGIDPRPLQYGQVRKSVSAEVNYGIRFAEYAELETFLRQLCGEVQTRLSDIRRKTKCITLKLMVRAKDAPLEASKFMGHGVCDSITKSVSLSEYTDDLAAITRTVLATMKALALPPNELRGIGIQLTKLDEPTELRERKENVIKNMFEKAAEKQKTRSPVKPAARPPPVSEASSNSPSKQSATNSSRGRPAAGKASPAKKRNHVLDLMQSAASKQRRHAERSANTALPPDIDPEVFAALPESIRIELLQERDLLTLTPPQVAPPAPKPANQLSDSDLLPSTSKAAQEQRQRKQQSTAPIVAPLQVDAAFLAALPADLRAEIEEDLQRQHNEAALKLQDDTAQRLEPSPAVAVDEDNIFAQANCTQLLRDWVKSCATPEPYDVQLISEHARQLVRAHQIDALYDALLYLCRLLHSRRGATADAHCGWHAAYALLIDAVQAEMRRVYAGRKLYDAGVKLKCDKCSC